MGLFGTRYLVSAKKAYFLVFRNKQRLGLALQGGDLLAVYIKLVVALSGICFTLWYFLFEGSTFTGRSIKDLSSITGPALLSVIACWYVAQVFGGAMAACVSTTLMCVACDEEMFARSQRYAMDELKAILDPIATEKTEEQRDLMPLGKIEAPGASKKKHFLGALDDGGIDAVINTYAYDNPDKKAEYKGLSPFDDDVVSTSRSVYQPNLFYAQQGTRQSSPDQDPVEDSRPSFSPATSNLSRSSRQRQSRK